MKSMIQPVSKATIVLSLIAPTLVLADNSYLQRQMDTYERSKKALLIHFIRDDAATAYSRTITALARTQVLMLSHGVPASDPRMVNHLAYGDDFKMKSVYDYPIFAYRVFKHELERKTGFRPDTSRLFSGNSIYVIDVE